jgi:aminopeptidase N
VGDEKKWFALLHDFYQHFKYQNILTDDVVAYVNQRSGMNLTPLFDQYLRHTALPVLELKFSDGAVEYRWQADEPAFAMPIRVGAKDRWTLVRPTQEWKTLKTTLSKDEFGVDSDHYFVAVKKD